jgi:hypothetical protein
MDTEKFLSHIRAEIACGTEAVRAKRALFRDRLRLYADTDKDRDKVSDNTIYATMQLSLAVLGSDDVNVEFSSRASADDERAERLSALARYDMGEMRLRELNYQKDWDRLFFGVGIRVKTGWDRDRKVPAWIVKDPLSWIPDPLGNHVDPFRFHYFEEEMFSSAMTVERGFDADAVASLAGDGSAPTVPVAVRNGYTWYDGKYYSVTTDGEATTLLRAVELSPDETGTVEEVVNISYFSPLRGDPYGVSLVDLVEDKQRANSILMNLRLIDAKFATFGQFNLFDSRAINRGDLTTPTLATKWIAFDSSLGVPISQAIYPVPRERIAQDSYAVSQELARRISLDTGLDNRLFGVEGDSSITYGESQQLQSNANVRLGLSLEIAHWGERSFWREWYRSYRRYFADSDEKTIRMQTGFGSKLVTLRREDIVSDEDPDVSVESRRIVAKREAERKQAFMARLPDLLSDLRTAPVTRKYALRKAYRFDGFSREEAMMLVPPDRDELFAEDLIRSLDRNELPPGLLESLSGRDLPSLLASLARAHETGATRLAIALVRKLMQEEPVTEPETTRSPAYAPAEPVAKSAPASLEDLRNPLS